ncbi:putative disease resistance protein RGA3 [Silene latifolia]|uniref:putative disease resistance protein RGA3 n=1 Tax=Silene latifolia TaxID=37657 RepID=UPI003D76AE2A
MAEAAALSLATDAAMAMGQLLMGRTIDEVKLVWGLKDELEKLQKKFSKLQLFLKDIGSAKHADKRRQVNDWLLEVKDAAYFADDIMDNYDYEIIRREREKKTEFVKQFQAFFTRNNPIVFRIRMSHRVSDALAMFDELDKNAQNMGLKQVEITKDGIAGPSANNDEGSARLSQARQNAAADATEFVGREDEMEKLLQLLCRPSNQEGHISTVAILGLGGLGKTTFARCLYDRKDIDAHFEKKLWISVSDNFTILRILNEMLEYVTSNKGNLSNIDAIIKKLQENLKNKKYLLVLDDVWCKDQEVWSSLKNALQRIGGLPGCLILITTRLIEVTTRSQAVTHLLRGLSEEEGWALLKQRVLVGGASPNFSILEDSGKKIVEKCQGVPLAIKAIGGILQSKQNPREWELIEKSEVWDLPQNDENQILPSLRLTFDHLPYPSLKQCFAYCAAFCPKGYVMEKDELVDIWLAQGFLHQSETKSLTMEEIGEDYIMVLQNYSLLNEVTGEKKYKMHDLVYDLAVDVCGKDLLFWKPEDHQKIYNCRHLVVGTQNVEDLSKLPMTKTLRKLRTLSEGLPLNVLAHAKYLRTLSVDGCDIKELPSSIGLLKHLRFLSLSYNPIKTLPDSIGKLYLLQTLRLLDCFDMKFLPAILYRLTNLIHIPTTTLMLASRGLQGLTNLHTLPHLSLGDDDDGWSIDELGDLQKLMGDIHISGLELVKTKDNARKANLAGKPKVSNITLAWAEEREEISCGSYDEDVLDGLQPHPDIISLELQNFFGLMFPSWMVRMAVVSEGGSSPSMLKNLTSFKLLNCNRCQMLPTLGHLPCLKYLVLSGLKVESIGNDFYAVPLNECNNKVNRVSFPSLTELEISEFYSLKAWLLPSTGEETIVFPRLGVIKLTNCPELETIPALDFPSLKTLELFNVGIQSLEITKNKPSSMLPPEVNLKLETLEISNCDKLLSLPGELQFVASLKTVNLTDCPALTSLPNDLFQGLTSLSELSICRCEALNNIPTSLEKCTSLETLTIQDCPSIEGPTPDFSKLTGLQEMYKSGNPAELMISMLKAVEHLPNLMMLATGKFKDEAEQEMYFSDVTAIQRSQSLTTLLLQGHPNVTPLPERLQLLSGLKTLAFQEFDDLEQLPEWVACLSSLEALIFIGCSNLKFLPSKEALSQLTQLRELEMIGCPILAESCDKDNGPDWSKISHIPYIEIDGVAIQNLP